MRPMPALLPFLLTVSLLAVSLFVPPAAAQGSPPGGYTDLREIPDVPGAEGIMPVIDPDNAEIFRLVVTFDGLVNPPGTLAPFDPFQFGPSPVFGFIDLDVDSDKDTGGECGCAAQQRFLANVARFGGRPQGSIGERAAILPEHWDAACEFDAGPQFERTGADFALVLCGCWDVTIVSQTGDMDGMFDAGETWIVRGRFLERAQGYKDTNDAFGGSDFGLYDPWTNVRFEHDIAAAALQPAGAETARPSEPGASTGPG